MVIFFNVGQYPAKPASRVGVCTGYNKWYPDPDPPIPGAKTRPGSRTRANHYCSLSKVRNKSSSDGVACFLDSTYNIEVIVIDIVCLPGRHCMPFKLGRSFNIITSVTLHKHKMYFFQPSIWRNTSLDPRFCMMNGLLFRNVVPKSRG